MGLKPTATVISSLVVAMKLSWAASLSLCGCRSCPGLQGALRSGVKASLREINNFSSVGIFINQLYVPGLRQAGEVKVP